MRINGFGNGGGRVQSSKEALASAPSTEDTNIQMALAHNKRPGVRRALASNSNISEKAALKLANDRHKSVVRVLARNPNISVDVKAAIIRRQD